MAYAHPASSTAGVGSTDDTDSHNTSSDGKLNGRFKFQVHSNAESLVAWFKRNEGCRIQKKRKLSAAALAGGNISSTSPRLNVAIHIVGSRGDVQPFIPIAKLLSSPEYGHRVRICTHPNFKEFVEGQGIEFFSIGGDPEALMSYMVRNPGLLPNRESVKAGDIGKRRKEMWDIITGSWRSCIEAGDGMGEGINAANVPDAKDLFIADAIIANPPSMAHIHCAERLSIPLHMVFTMPWSPTQTFSHPLASMKIDKDTSRTTANYFSFMMMELLTWQGLGDLINKFRTRILCIDPISPMWGYQLLARLQVPYSYLWSQTLIPKPPDWGSHINITGFSFLRLGTSYTPDPELAAFLQEGPAPIYIGFGSIVVKDSDAFTKLILKAVEISGVRALVSKGWGGFSVDNIPKNVFFLGNVPHDWLFQHVSAVVHHGGAGTTAAGIAAGRPTVIVPFFGDQPFWGQMIARAGAGPSPIPFKDMTAESLAASIHFALKPEVQEAVHRLADQIDSEDGAVATAADFQERLELDQLRCDIYPDRLAIWSHKGTGAHLSSFAAGSLVVAREIKSKDLKLMRKRHWYVDEGAEHPLIGAIAAFTGLGSALGAATSEFKNRVRRRQKLTNTTVTNEIDLEQTADKEPTVPTPQAQRQIPITDMERFARKIATKSLHGFEMVSSQLPYKPTLRERRKAFWAGKEKGRYGKQFYLLRATGRLTADVTKACLETPVAFFYNVANGFHNYPSYSLLSIDVRRRDEITDLSSGLQIAGKEFVVGLFDAFTGLVVKPYQGWQKDGAKGFGKGIAGGGLCLVYGLGASIWGLPGYSLKGIEKEFSKHHLTELEAEIHLIHLRQGIEEYREASQEDRDATVTKWKFLYN